MSKEIERMEWDKTDENKLTAIEQRIAAEMVGETEEKRIDGLKQMRDFIRNQPHIIKAYQGAYFLQYFLRTKHYNVKKAVEYYNRYLIILTKYPHYYKPLSLQDPVLRSLFTRGAILPLLEKDNDGRTVLILDTDLMSTSEFLEYFNKTVLAAVSVTLFHNTASCLSGHTMVFKCTRPDTWLQQPTAQIVEYLITSQKMGEGQIKRMILFGFGSMFPIGIIRRAANHLIYSTKINTKLAVCESWDELEKLGIPKKILPQEYGGELPIKIIADDWLKKADEFPYKEWYETRWNQMEVDKEFATKYKPNTPTALAFALPLLDKIKHCFLGNQSEILPDDPYKQRRFTL